MADEKPLNLRQKLIRVMADVGNVPKEGQNQQGAGYKYQRIADMVPKVQAACIKHGIVFLAHHLKTEWHQPHESRGGAQVFVCSVDMGYEFRDTDTDESITCSASGFAFDTSDKSENKAKTAALKYFLKQTFLIGEEDEDSEKETIETQYRQAHRGRKPEADGGGAARKPPEKLAPEAYQEMVDLLRQCHVEGVKNEKGNPINIADFNKRWGAGNIANLEKLGADPDIELALYRSLSAGAMTLDNWSLLMGKLKGMITVHQERDRVEL